ncbi:helix-turn-helix domain-containing protein [Acidovorax sp. ACV02]|uniref:helix-turn-helix domain-containing protein n=1 Tax=Acidovorax sp. ACV02 TaxID=2769310 RepID=UPI001780EEDF|nr:helix-turn-helix transcriptional regulator [Acidovorax sp. ACV02]MBD9407155.1 helix-turn-helix domain-containing protein [Acidovorax sp. ACV02]
MSSESTAFGRSFQPNSDSILSYRIRMDRDSKHILWQNVSALMQRDYGKENLTALSKNAHIGPGTVTRIKEQETSVGLDVLDKVARAFKIEPWQLLQPKLGVIESPEPTSQPSAATSAPIPISRAPAPINGWEALRCLHGLLLPEAQGARRAVVSLLEDLANRAEDHAASEKAIQQIMYVLGQGNDPAHAFTDSPAHSGKS